jgi:hypothetical protein
MRMPLATIGDEQPLTNILDRARELLDHKRVGSLPTAAAPERAPVTRAAAAPAPAPASAANTTAAAPAARTRRRAAAAPPALPANEAAVPPSTREKRAPARARRAAADEDVAGQARGVVLALGNRR